MDSVQRLHRRVVCTKGGTQPATHQTGCAGQTRLPVYGGDVFVALYIGAFVLYERPGKNCIGAWHVAPRGAWRKGPEEKSVPTNDVLVRATKQNLFSCDGYTRAPACAGKPRRQYIG